MSEKLNGHNGNGHANGHDLALLRDYAQVLEVTRWFQPWEAITEKKRMLEKEGESMIVELGRAPLPTDYGDWTYIEYGDKTTEQHHKLLVYGNINNSEQTEGSLLVRLHSACWTNEVGHATNCECRKEINEAMRMIQEEGKGAIVYLDQEGRGTGIAGKMAQLNGMFEWREGRVRQGRDTVTGERIDTDRAYREAGFPSECRDFTVAGEILKAVGINKVRLITNNPGKIMGVASAGIEVEPVSIHIKPDNEIIASDLRSKAINLGHAIPASAYQFNGKHI